MPNTNYMTYDPELQRLQRQQRYAELLQQQANEPIPIESGGGAQAPISPFSLLAKALQAYSGRKMLEQGDTQYADLQAKRQKELADMLSKQYQVPGQEAQGIKQTDIAPIQTDIGGQKLTLPGIQADPNLGAISNATQARPTTPEEQLANSLSMMGSSNPEARQMGMPLYQGALQKQQVADLAGNQGPPPGVAPMAWKAALLSGDPDKIASLTQQGQQQLAAQNTLPPAIKEYELAVKQGFKGSLTDYQRTKAQAIHVTTGGAAANAPAPMSADDKASIGAQVATGMPLNQVIPGFSKAVAGERREARQQAIKLIMSENPGMTAADAGVELANRSIAYQGGKKSIGQLTTMLGATKQAVNQLDFNVDKVGQEMAKLGSTDASPILNAIARGEQKWTGNPAYSSLFFYMHAAAMESARILQGGQASIAQLHAGAAEQAKEWANINMTPASWKAVAEAMKAEGANRIENYTTAINDMKFGKHTKPDPNEAPKTATEADIQHTMHVRKMTRQQVIDKLKERGISVAP